MRGGWRRMQRGGNDGCDHHCLSVEQRQQCRTKVLVNSHVSCVAWQPRRVRGLISPAACVCLDAGRWGPWGGAARHAPATSSSAVACTAPLAQHSTGGCCAMPMQRCARVRMHTRKGHTCAQSARLRVLLQLLACCLSGTDEGEGVHGARPGGLQVQALQCRLFLREEDTATKD